MTEDLDYSRTSPEEMTKTPESGSGGMRMEFSKAKRGLWNNQKGSEELLKKKDSEIQRLTDELNAAVRDKKCMKFCANGEQVKRLKKRLQGFKLISEKNLSELENDREERWKLEKMVKDMVAMVEDVEVGIENVVKN